MYLDYFSLIIIYFLSQKWQTHYQKKNKFQQIMCMLSQSSPGPKTKKLQGSIIFNKFKVIKKLAAGSFGSVYVAQSLNKTPQLFAVKAEPASSKTSQILMESKIYKYLHLEGELHGIPKVYGCGTQAKHNLLVMDLLGLNLLQTLIAKGPLPSNHVKNIGAQLLHRIETLHKRGFVHRDIKPDNIAFGIEDDQNLLYLYDMGLCNKFLGRDKTHIKFQQGKELTGTALYASINTHKGLEQSRRDDIESIGYVLLHLLMGDLPWKNLKATSIKNISDGILQKKMNIKLEQMCGNRGWLKQVIEHGRRLQFQEEPQYERLRELLKVQDEEKKE